MLSGFALPIAHWLSALKAQAEWLDGEGGKVAESGFPPCRHARAVPRIAVGPVVASAMPCEERSKPARRNHPASGALPLEAVPYPLENGPSTPADSREPPAD